jgi:hypothetical protein
MQVVNEKLTQETFEGKESDLFKVLERCERLGREVLLENASERLFQRGYHPPPPHARGENRAEVPKRRLFYQKMPLVEARDFWGMVGFICERVPINPNQNGQG